MGKRKPRKPSEYDGPITTGLLAAIREWQAADPANTEYRLAKLAGIQQTTLSQWLRSIGMTDEATLRVATADKIAAALGLRLVR